MFSGCDRQSASNNFQGETSTFCGHVSDEFGVETVPNQANASNNHSQHFFVTFAAHEQLATGDHFGKARDDKNTDQLVFCDLSHGQNFGELAVLSFWVKNDNGWRSNDFSGSRKDQMDRKTQYRCKTVLLQASNLYIFRNMNMRNTCI